MTGYDPMTIWLVFFIVGIGTYALRLSFIILFGRLDDVPVWIEGVLRFVPPAALAALIVPAIISLSLGPSLGQCSSTRKYSPGQLRRSSHGERSEFSRRSASECLRCGACSSYCSTVL
ncbi:AzlD domain-containing protein [Halocatena marina]|uniref:AzlD domain-containing protein n=1 Tax=Halocatena marina TaxID=2934937 RepID=UPI00362214CC